MHDFSFKKWKIGDENAQQLKILNMKSDYPFPNTNNQMNK
jgi:hypothetical protein